MSHPSEAVARPVWKAAVDATATWLLHCIVAGLVMLVFGACVPRWIRLFEETDVDLPSATILAVHLSDYVVHWWYTLLMPLILDGLFLLVVALGPQKNRWLGRAWSALVLFCAILLLVFTMIAVTLPLAHDGPVQLGVQPAPIDPAGPSE